MRPSLQHAPGQDVLISDHDCCSLVDEALLSYKLLSEFQYPITLMPPARRAIGWTAQNINSIATPNHSPLSTRPTDKMVGDKSDYSDDSDSSTGNEEISATVDVSQLEGRSMEFTDPKGSRRVFNLIKALGCSTAGVFRVEEVTMGTEQNTHKKQMVLKIPVLEMASGVLTEYGYDLTGKLQKQLRLFIQSGGMRDWLQRAGEEINEVLIPEEVQNLLKCSPPSRYEVLDVLLSFPHMQELQSACVERGFVYAWEVSDFGKTVVSWATVCLLNPLHEETIARCLSAPAAGHRTPMPACVTMLSQDEWAPIPGARVFNCRLMEEAAGVPLYGLVKKVNLARWKRDSLYDREKPFMPSTRAETETLTNAAVELAYQLDRSGFVQADDQQNFRLVRKRDGNFSHMTCIDGASVHPIAGHSTAHAHVLRETEATIARYRLSSQVFATISMSLLSFWTRPLGTELAFSTEDRLLAAVRKLEPRVLGYSRELRDELELNVFSTYDGDLPTTLRHWTIMQAAMRQSHCVDLPRYVRRILEQKMLQYGTQSDEWFEAVIRKVYTDISPNVGAQTPPIHQLSRVLDRHIQEIGTLEEIDKPRVLSISISSGMEFGLFECVENLSQYSED